MSISIRNKSKKDSYHIGWHQKDQEKIELYLTILNDLAENIEVKNRHTKELLVECLGYISRRNDNLINSIEEIKTRYLVSTAQAYTDALIFVKNMEERLDKGN